MAKSQRDHEPRWGPPFLRWAAPVALVGALGAGAVLGVLAIAASGHAPVSQRAFVDSYDQRVLTDPLEILIVQSDGQAFAALARDPSLDRPELFRSPEEAAYRAQRPLVPYLAWAASLGRPGWVPPALAGLAVAGTGLAVGALAVLFGRRLRWLGLLALALPGTLSALTYLGPEPLVLGLVASGVVAWRERHAGWAGALLALAALGRETALVVPVALAAWLVWQRRGREAAVIAGLPTAAFAAWVLVLGLRVGAFPWEAETGRLALPFGGLVEAATGLWSENSAALAPVYAALALLLVGAVLRHPRHPLAWVVVAHAGLASVLGPLVWESDRYFTRPLLPLFAFGLVTALAPLGDRAPQPATVGAQLRDAPEPRSFAPPASIPRERSQETAMPRALPTESVPARSR